MRWNCPHCGISLAVADDKLGTGWSFSRCYKCAGFALVRRSDVNLIKVDRAPAGEQVLLPEATEEPTAMLSQQAAAHLARYVGNGSHANNGRQPQQPPQKSAKAAAPRAAATPPARNPHLAANAAMMQMQALQAQTHPAQVQAQPTHAPAPLFGINGLPSPLPETPLHSLRERMLPVAIGLTGILAIGTGIYLYIQGQQLWEKAKSQASAAQARAERSVANAPAETAYESANEIISAPPMPVHAGAVAAAPANVPSTATVLGRLPSNVPIAAEANLAANEVADEVHEVHAAAMTPARRAPQLKPKPGPAAVEVKTPPSNIAPTRRK